MESINTKDELITILNIDDISKLNSQKYQEKFIEIVKNNKISPELFKEILTFAPMLTETFNQIFKTMSNIGNSLEDTKRLRWEILKELAIKDKLSSNQILEAMNLLKEIEQNENIDWTKIFTLVGGIGGGLIIALGYLISSKNET